MKSGPVKIILASIFLLGLTGCESINPPHVFGINEVPAEVVNEPRVVERPKSNEAQDATWMRLGDVPSKPKDFTSDKLVEETRQEMRNDRAEADKLKEQVEGPAPVSPSAPQP